AAADQWSSGNNWSPSAPTNGIDTILTFVNDNTTNFAASTSNTSTNDLAGFQLNQLDLQGTAATAAGNSTININGNSLTFTNTGASAVLNIDPSLTFTATGVTQSSALVKSGNGAMLLTGTNSHNSTQLNAGRLLIAGAAALGSGTLILNGGTFDNTSGSAMTI